MSTSQSLANDSQASSTPVATPNDLAEKMESWSIQSLEQTAPIPAAPRIDSKHVQSSQGDDCSIQQLKSFFINVFDEPSASAEEMLSHEMQLMKEYQEREGVCWEEWMETMSGGR